MHYLFHLFPKKLEYTFGGTPGMLQCRQFGFTLFGHVKTYSFILHCMKRNSNIKDKTLYDTAL